MLKAQSILKFAVIILVATSYIVMISEGLIGAHILHLGVDNSINYMPSSTVSNGLTTNKCDTANDSTNDSIILANMDAHKNLRYNLPNKPTYILRLDDVQTSLWSDISMKIINDTLNRNMSISIAVIPDRDGSDEYGMVEFIREHKNDPHLEITQHGTYHSKNEYGNLSANETRLLTMKGLRKLYSSYGVCPVTFIPPNNAIDNTTANTLYDMGFRVVASQGTIHYDGNILDVGHGASTAMPDETTLINPEDVVNKCNEYFQKENLCVIMIHPQNFVSSDRKTLDPAKYATYIEMLQELEATKAQSFTFTDMLNVNETI